ncbi:MAG: C39 family peptidase [Caldilineaceae bacterium]|nr:C39 family peptidase [Caldilineaceae bacterium]
MTLLSISHLRQSRQADCLAACAQMVLQYLQISISYARLLDILETEQSGSYFSKLKNLESEFGLIVELAQGSENLDALYRYLDQALPIIAYVNTGQLRSYWRVTTFHAVIITGLDEEFVYLNDPYFGDAPKEVSRDEFILAWLEQDFWYVVIRLAEP